MGEKGERSRPLGSPWDAALRYLGQRSHSRLELEQKLSRRGFSSDEVDDTIRRLDQAGLIDDQQFAAEYARSVIQARGLSSREVARRLRQRGIEQRDIETALGDVAEGDFDRALEVAGRRLDQMGDLDTQTRRRRLLSYLGRRGFSEELCYAVVRRLV